MRNKLLLVYSMIKWRSLQGGPKSKSVPKPLNRIENKRVNEARFFHKIWM